MVKGNSPNNKNGGGGMFGMPAMGGNLFGNSNKNEGMLGVP